MAMRLFFPFYVYVCVLNLCLIHSISTAQSEIPQQVMDWQKAAQESIAKEDPATAVRYYQKIQQAFPNTDHAMQAQAGIAIACLKANKTTDANTAVQKLLADYADYPDVAKCIREVSTEYLNENQPAQSKQLCQTVLAKWPSYEEMFAIQRNLAMAHVLLGEFAEAETVTAKLLKDYPDRSELAKGMRKIAYAYFKAQQPDKAKELCLMALSKWPNDSEAILVRRDLAINYIRLGEYDQAESVTAQLIADYYNHPKIAEYIRSIATYYFSPNKPEKAKELCQLALSNWPKHSNRAKTTSILADAMIKLGEIKQADELTANLISSYSDHVKIGDYIQKSASYYLEHGQPSKAQELYQTVLQKWPNTQDVAMAQAGLAASYLRLGDSASAQTATTTLLSDFKEHKNFASSVSWLADQYIRNNTSVNNTKAMDLYKYVLTLNPNDNVQLCCISGIARIQVRLGDDASVGGKVDYLLSRLGKTNSNEVASCVFEVGEEYNLMAEKMSVDGGAVDDVNKTCQKAINIWSIGIQKLPLNSIQAPSYAYYMGISYQQMKQHKEAVSYFQQVLEKWPQYNRAWDAQAMLIECYKQLKRDNKLSASEADSKIQSAYQNILNNYPDSPAAKIASRQLGSSKKDN